MKYSEDDMADYANEDDEQFDEDALNDGDYNSLCEALAQLKPQVEGKFQGLDEYKMKELLWNNYYSVEDTVANIKADYKPTARKAGGLQGLLAKRAQGGSSGLAGLLKKREGGGMKNGPETGLRGIAGLRGGLKSGLSARKRQRTEGGGLRGLRGMARSVAKVVSEKPVLKSEESEKSEKESETKSETKSESPKSTFAPPLDPVLPTLPSPPPSSSLIGPQLHLTKVFFAESPAPKINESQLDLFSFLTNDSARRVARNFAQPSPDDKRRNVDQVTKGVAKVSLGKKAVSKGPKKKVDVNREVQKRLSKPSLSFVVIGHIDSGKSTMIGRLLYDLGIVDSKTMHKLTKESEQLGKSSFSLAWVMDQTPEERARGVTVDICQTQFETEKSRFSVIDSPGHRDYVPQMINGVTQADVAVMIIDASSFESGFGDDGQTKEHMTIARSLGIERCIVAVNQLDSVDWSEGTYNEYREQLQDFLVGTLKFAAENVSFVPTSGYLGDNVVKKSKNTPWYHGQTLMELLEGEAKNATHPKLDKKSSFVLTVNDLESGSRPDEVSITGRVNSGMVQAGESVSISPSGQTGQIESISVSSSSAGSPKEKKEKQSLAIEGEFVELKVRRIDTPDNIHIGDLVSKEPIVPTSKFQCEITCFNLDRPLLVGTPFILFRGNISIPCRLSKVHQVVTAQGKVNKKRKHLASHNSGLVDIEILERPVPMLTAAQGKMGRIVMRKDGKTIGAGKVVKTVEEDK